MRIPQLKAAEVHYSACRPIDRHKRFLNNFLDIEKKLITQNWSKRVNISIFGMCVQDAWIFLHGAVEGNNESYTSQDQFYKNLAH